MVFLFVLFPLLAWGQSSNMDGSTSSADTNSLSNRLDALTAIVATKVSKSDSTDDAEGHYASHTDMTNGLAGKATPQDIADSLDNLTLGMNLTTDRDSIVVIDNDSLKFVKDYSTVGIFNVLDYGAIADTSINSTVAFQNAIDAAEDGLVIIPSGKYRVDTLKITQDVNIEGQGWTYDPSSTIIYSRYNAPIININFGVGDGWGYGATIKNLMILGDTTKTSQVGVKISGQAEVTLERLYITECGNHGVYFDSSKNTVYTKIIQCRIENNQKDGIHGKGSDANQLNAIRIKDSHIILNNGNGIDIFGTNIVISGNVIEKNLGIGLFISGRSLGAVTCGVYGMLVQGNYMELNVGGNIVAESYLSGGVTQYINNLSIKDNYLYITNAITAQNANIVLRAATSTSYHLMFSGLLIQGNSYAGDLYQVSGSIGGASCAFSPTGTVYVSNTPVTTYYTGLTGVTIFSERANSPAVYKYITTGGITTLNSVIRCVPQGGAIDITADPQIIDGVDGQVIVLIGTDDTETLTLEDGTGLQLAGGSSFVMGIGDIITLIYCAWLDLWVEISRSNN